MSKRYGATQALDRVSFSIEPGTVHALLGGNGCGKSTLIKILAGVTHADEGTIAVNGETCSAREITPELAAANGFRFVHQQPSVIADLSVAENIAFGRDLPLGRLGGIRWREVRRRAQAALDRLGSEIDVTAPASSLRPAGQAIVAIARALQDLDHLGRGVLVLDVPTAALPAAEVATLMDAVRRYAAEGLSVLFVSHRLEEVLELASAATILRDGVVSSSLGPGEIEHDRLVEGIVGGAVTLSGPAPSTARAGGVPRLAVAGLGGGRLRDVSFELPPGEVVGIAGLLGSGRSSLLRVLFGFVAVERGEIRIDGELAPLRSVEEAIAAGIAYVPEDRANDALFGALSVDENLSVVTTGDYWRRGLLRRRAERRDSRELLSAFAIKAAGTEVPVTSLSGGNQQKVVLARWLRRPLRLLLLDEPTQGVDIGARAEIYEAIGRAASSGTTVLVASSEFEELTQICSRVLVLADGRIVADLVNSVSDPVQLEHLVHSGGRSV